MKHFRLARAMMNVGSGQWQWAVSSEEYVMKRSKSLAFTTHYPLPAAHCPLFLIGGNQMLFPQDPIAAVTHPDPYAYYADLASRKPLYYDEGLRLWVASSAGAVTSILTNDHCRVRPANEPVPQSLLGSPAAEIFRHLVRMNDGERHCPFKLAVSAALASIDAVQVSQQSVKWARFLLEELGSERISRFAFHLSVYVVGSL